MPGQRYTSVELLRIRESPLVQKPENLPSIDQWLDQLQEPNQKKPRTQSARVEDASPMGNFASQRPSLLQTRQLSRTTGDEVILGPPKTSFASSRSIAKLLEAGDTPSTPSAGDDDRDLDSLSVRTKYFKDREEQGQMKKDRESWTAGRGSKNYEARTGYEDKERGFGRYQRDRGERNAEGEENGNRRNGYGAKADQRWSREGDKPAGRMQGREGGWRDREKRTDRDYDRGGHTEKEPEWFEEPLEKEDDQPARNADEFEKWKNRMRASKTPAAEKENIEVPTEARTPAAVKTSAPLVPEAGFSGGFFGTWGGAKDPEIVAQPEPTPAKIAPANKKSSRFASMFAPKEEMKQQIEPPVSPLPLVAAANGSNEDREGFQRMLQMLRGTTVSTPGGTPQANNPMLNLFGSGLQEAAMPQPPQSPQGPGLQALFGKPSQGRSNRPESAIGPGAAPTHPPERVESQSQQRHQSQDMQSVFLEQPPRNISTPEAQNIQSLLAGQRSQKNPSLNKDSEFLLNLIQTKNASRPPSQAARPPEQDNFQLFLDQPPRHQPQQPRGPPPGFHPDQLFQQHMPPEHMQETRPRPPPGFPDDASIMHQKGPSFPPDPPSPQARRQPPPGFQPHPNEQAFFQNQMQSHQHPQQDRIGIPPPGFPSNLRHPQGFPNMPTMFQQPNGPPPPGPGQQMPLPPHSHPQQGPPGGMRDMPQGFGGMVPPPGFFSGPNHAPGLPPGFGAGGPPMGMQGPPQGMAVSSPDLRSPMEGPGMFGIGPRR